MSLMPGAMQVNGPKLSRKTGGSVLPLIVCGRWYLSNYGASFFSLRMKMLPSSNLTLLLRHVFHSRFRKKDSPVEKSDRGLLKSFASVLMMR